MSLVTHEMPSVLPDVGLRIGHPWIGCPNAKKLAGS
jgi:hypothetical protein